MTAKVSYCKCNLGMSIYGSFKRDCDTSRRF
nr:MAG TPA: hypothetical protein [Caudoviricetes sp.]DAY34057.1 MAG TPA: hypothetical protein [Caudoviricetes sp.]